MTENTEETTNKPRTVAVPRSSTEIASTNGMTGTVQRSGELAAAALASQAKAAVEARYVMAIQRPRDWLVVRERLLVDCRRPSFAKQAIYHKPIGKGVEGPSIRFAEAVARAMGNVYCPVFAIYDDAEKRVSRVTATDLERNVTFDKDVTISKTVERNSLQQGQVALSTRVGSRGQIVYIIEATDDDILNKENAIASKAMRECILRLMPGDIKDEALDICRETTEKKIAEDPDAEQKMMLDAFKDLNVSVDQLKEYLGHPIEQTTVAEMTKMRALFLAIRDGEATWREAMDNRDAGKAKGDGNGNGNGPATDPAAAASAGKPKDVNQAAEAAKARREGAAPPSGQKQSSLPTGGEHGGK